MVMFFRPCTQYSSWGCDWNILGGLVIPPASTKLKVGYNGFTLSVCQSVDRIVSALDRSSTVLIGSISYLHILSSNFRRCVACKVCFKIGGVSSECRHSVCSSSAWGCDWHILGGLGQYWLLMSWRLASPGHQQSREWLCRINRSLSSMRRDFKYIDGLAQDCSNSSALALELLQSCANIKPSTCALSVSRNGKKCKYISMYPRIILCMGPANERQCYIVTSPLIGWAHTKNDPCVASKQFSTLKISFDINHPSVHVVDIPASKTHTQEEHTYIP